MANNIKIGNTNPDAILFGKHIEEQDGDALWDYVKYTDEGGGYYVHGLWLAPCYNTTLIYWWPWDLNIPGGALKDDNAGYARWGYVNDGRKKDITQGMRENFPTNGWNDATWAIGITFYGTFNSFDGKGFDFGDNPIIIEFLDGRFDDCTFTIGNSSNDITISEDKRTVTIRKCVGNLAVSIIPTERTVEQIRILMKNVHAKVTGLTYHKATFQKPVDVSSVECWDAYLGSEEHLFHKDKTLENCWKKYGYCTKVEGNSNISNWIKLGDNTGIETEADKCIPYITDLYDHMKVLKDPDKEYRAFSNIESALAFNYPIHDKTLNDAIVDWLKNNTIPCSLAESMLKGSNIKGDVLEVNIYDGVFYAPGTENIPSDNVNSHIIYKSFYNWPFEALDFNTFKLNFRDYGFCPSPQHLFRSTEFEHIEVTTLADYKSKTGQNAMLGARDCSGMFEFAGYLQEIPDNIIDYGAVMLLGIYDTGSGNYGYMFEYCGSLDYIGSFNLNGKSHTELTEEERSHKNNVLCPNTCQQMFNGCSAKYIGPVIDMRHIDPSVEGSKQIFSCEAVTDMRIRNLNHGTWHLDGTTSSNGVYHGYLKSLDATSVKYLFDNLTDLTIHNPNNTLSASTCFGKWSTGVPNMVALRYNSIQLYKTLFDDNVINTELAYAEDPVSNMTVVASGIKEGMVIQIGNTQITENGTYTINSTGRTSVKIISVVPSLAEEDEIYLTISADNVYRSSNPKVSSAELHCPSEWEITDEMITAANAKGWSIYKGGEIV